MNEQEVNNLYAFYWKYLSKGRQLENKKYSQSMKRPRKSIDSNHVERERKSKGRNIDEVLEDLEEERLLNKLDFLNISGNISQRMRAAYENNSPHIDISSNRQTLQEKYSDQECHSDSSDEDSSDQETNKYEAFRYPSEYLKDLEVNYENYLNKPNNIMLHMSHQTNSLMRKYARLQRDHEQYLSTRSDSACILCHTIDESTNNIILTCSVIYIYIYIYIIEMLHGNSFKLLWGGINVPSYLDMRYVSISPEWYISDNEMCPLHTNRGKSEADILRDSPYSLG